MRSRDFLQTLGNYYLSKCDLLLIAKIQRFFKNFTVSFRQFLKALTVKLSILKNSRCITPCFDDLSYLCEYLFKGPFNA